MFRLRGLLVLLFEGLQRLLEMVVTVRREKGELTEKQSCFSLFVFRNQEHIKEFVIQSLLGLLILFRIMKQIFVIIGLL